MSDLDALCPSWAVFVGYSGVACAATLSNFGSAWGTWKSGVSIVHSGIRYPEGVMKNIIPVVMAGVIGIYGLIVAVILGQSIDTPNSDRYNIYSTYTAMAHLCAGLCCGLSGLAAGGCIGIVGDYGIRCVGYRCTKVSIFESTTHSLPPPNPENNEERQRLLTSDHQQEQQQQQQQQQNQYNNNDDEDYEPDDQNKLYVSMLIMLIFSEALALYGLIVALIVSQNSYVCEGNELYYNVAIVR